MHNAATSGQPTRERVADLLRERAAAVCPHPGRALQPLFAPLSESGAHLHRCDICGRHVWLQTSGAVTVDP